MTDKIIKFICSDCGTRLEFLAKKNSQYQCLNCENKNLIEFADQKNEDKNICWKCMQNCGK